MPGIYIHIPFCKSACHYCNFHFTTSLHYKERLVNTLVREMELRKNYLHAARSSTLYFGGGTPSLLSTEELLRLVEAAEKNFGLEADAEITLETNPDDISENSLAAWKAAGINRLSIGIQSFFETDLQWMNRAHTAEQATESLARALQYFPNTTIDLIYGTPGLTDERWQQNVQLAIAAGVPHLSCYALTVEPRTPLEKLVREGKKADTDADTQARQFLLLMDWLQQAGYEHYEISNFAKPGWRSRHNSAYWQAASGATYIGIGPSAHSFNGKERQWNISNNMQYMQAIEAGQVPAETEILTPVQQLNEYIMTALRTSAGIDVALAAAVYGADPVSLENKAARYISNGTLLLENNRIVLTREGKLLADGIAADLFY